MVSNDDVDLTRLQPILQNIKQQSVTSDYSEQIYTVPSDKKWSLIAAYIDQGTADRCELRLEDITGTSFEIWRISAIRGGFIPAIKMTLPAGWKIKFAFQLTTSRFMISTLLIEEEQLY